MGFYRRFVFPRLMNAVMSAAPEKRYRASTLATASGDTLEIGFGTGLNLPHYPPNLRKITALDANPGMYPVAQRNLRNSPIPVDFRLGRAEAIPFDDGSFDTVVSTWTLCSIGDPHRALREVHRVLRPGGRFLFVEHGLSREPKVEKWQHRITPLNRRIADGCHLDRDIRALVEMQPWRIESLREFYAEKTPKIFGALYQGVAVR